MTKKFIPLLLIFVLLASTLSSCKTTIVKQSESEIKKTEYIDERLIMADPDDYTNSPRHNVPQFQYHNPDAIILIRDDVVVGEYPKSDGVYEKILQLHTDSLQENLRNYREQYKEQMKEPYPHQTYGMVGYSVETENGSVGALLNGTYLVYTYTENTYAPVYFDMKAPSDCSHVISAQPVLEGESRGPFAFETTQELWDYLSEMEKE